MVDIILKILSFLWNEVFPISLVLLFFVGVFYNLWKVQELNVYLSGGISIGLVIIAVIAFGKLLKFW